jgi:hypothetical protein
VTRRLLTLAMLLAGCTTVSATPVVIYVTPSPAAETPIPTAMATATIAPTAAPKPTTVPTAASTPTVSAVCQTTLQGLYDAERDLDAKLDVGITEADYGRAVQDISVAENRMGNMDSISQDRTCLHDVALPLANAVLEYADAGDTWNKCVVKPSCTNASIKPQLQAHWSKAHDYIAGVEAIWPQ